MKTLTSKTTPASRPKTLRHRRPIKAAPQRNWARIRKVIRQTARAAEAKMKAPGPERNWKAVEVAIEKVAKTRKPPTGAAGSPCARVGRLSLFPTV